MISVHVYNLIICIQNKLADDIRYLNETIEQDKQKVSLLIVSFVDVWHFCSLFSKIKSMHLQLTKATSERDDLKSTSNCASEEVYIIVKFDTLVAIVNFFIRFAS